MEQLVFKVDNKNKELSKVKKISKRIKEELEGITKKDQKTKEERKIKKGKVDFRRESLTEEEAKRLLFEKFYKEIKQQLNKYLNTEKKELIKIFEKLWDKYRVPLVRLKEERDEEVRELDEFLVKLGYYHG